MRPVCPPPYDLPLSFSSALFFFSRPRVNLTILMATHISFIPSLAFMKVKYVHNLKKSNMRIRFILRIVQHHEPPFPSLKCVPQKQNFEFFQLFLLFFFLLFYISKNNLKLLFICYLLTSYYGIMGFCPCNMPFLPFTLPIYLFHIFDFYFIFTFFV